MDPEIPDGFEIPDPTDSVHVSVAPGSVQWVDPAVVYELRMPRPTRSWTTSHVTFSRDQLTPDWAMATPDEPSIQVLTFERTETDSDRYRVVNRMSRKLEDFRHKYGCWPNGIILGPKEFSAYALMFYDDRNPGDIRNPSFENIPIRLRQTPGVEMEYPPHLWAQIYPNREGKKGD